MRMHQVKNAAPRETLLAAYEMRDAGYNQATIARILGVPHGTVWGWFERPERFDPYYDEVALERALNGERKVFDNLTIYEADEFYSRVEARALAEPYDAKLHHVEYETGGNIGTRKAYWMHDLEQRLGMSRGWLRQAVRNRQRARVSDRVVA